MAIELPEFATSGATETEPSEAKKASGWAGGDQPSAEEMNWLHRTTYESIKTALVRGTVAIGGVQNGVLEQAAAGFGNAAILADAGRLVMLGEVTVTPEAHYSDDEGVTWTSATFTGTTSDLRRPAVVPGVFAVAFTASASSWYYSASPFTSWTEVAAATFNSTSTGRGRGVTTFEGAASLVVTDATYLAYCDASAAPTSAGDWSFSADLSSIFGTDVRGICSDGVNNYIVGTHGGTTARFASAAIADGAAVGDWTTVDIASGQALDVVYHQGKLIALLSSGRIYHSYDDGASWVSVATVGTSAEVLTADDDLGVIFAYVVGGDVHVSSDGINWVLGTAAADNNADAGAGTSPRYAWDTTRKRLYGTNGGALAPFG